jgi:hypothetical protein
MSLAPVALVGNAIKPANDTPAVTADPKKCDEAGCKKQEMTGATFIWKKDYCAYTLASSPEEHWQCSLDGKQPSIPATPVADDHKCTDDKSCKEKNKDAAWDATLAGCYTQPKEGNKVFVCNADGAEKKPEAKKCTDKQKADGDKCLETAESCKAKAKKDEFLKPSDDGLSCVAVSGSELCDLKNKEWSASKKKDSDDDDGVSWSTRYRWNSETKKCDDKEKKKESKDDDNSPDEAQAPQYAPKQAPGRFQPINIPTRQMYILPGMP